ncbi:hypothetical protein ACFWN2_04245 [Lentzea sp. NPDC058436]|uniref:hypothetical protein n=1 Tax=Lentzea sp. NPDC058436 TaxID=3346499 RepID=UPI0036525CD3
MVYDDDTGRPANFEIDPPEPDGARNAPRTETEERIIGAARQHPTWSAGDVAKHVSSTSNQNITADVVSFVLRRAQRDSRHRR